MEVFQGLKVLDLGWAIAVPWMVKYLADHGAEVIHIESKTHPDIIRAAPPFKENIVGIDRSAYFANYHNNKYSLSLNLNHPRSRVVIERLIKWADVLVENFTPGVMKRWGLNYEEVKKIKPDIIMLSQSQFGQTGPLSVMPGTGIQLTAYTGFSFLTGWEDREPSILYGGYTDCAAARFGAIALISALLYRRRTGKGMYIDLSQYEAGLHLLSPLLLDFQASGRIAKRQGNRHPFACPHNIYPCKGDDNWIAITVFTDEEWQGLCQEMGSPEWTKEERFSTFTRRKENEEELDRLIGEWTRNFTPQELMDKLQRAGVPAGVVQKCEDLYNDPQLQHREYFWEMEHPVIGKFKAESHAFQLSKTPRKLKMPAPLIGQHNEYICIQILGMSDEEFVELLNEGVFD